ncbi:conserved hypothetical protein [Methanococcus vannielii SB]|uniref:Uncharacterized protein n=1 Tax=Methanococcus vannielii (strain ATCC 35089 / DSM 1224 / JCM 13029 / OCM 148 / SB) TaxID=406327 RepID=A6USL2_METVS|nr:MarR family transcriptional regulator [Methanococcus vannielii]ABR55484.1 conserved hypothetical protein [Methanococcus vannielii SB]
MASQDDILYEFYNNDGILSTDELKKISKIPKEESIRSISKTLNSLIHKKLIGKVKGPKNSTIYFLTNPYYFICDDDERILHEKNHCLNVIKKVMEHHDGCIVYERKNMVILKFNATYQIRNHLKLIKSVIDTFGNCLKYVLHDNYIIITGKTHLEIDMFNINLFLNEKKEHMFQKSLK